MSCYGNIPFISENAQTRLSVPSYCRRDLIGLIPENLKDTKHVLASLRNYQWNKSSVWVMADITSLYTIIPHDLALIGGNIIAIPIPINIYVAWWKRQFLFSPSSPFFQDLKWHGRYIDDLLIICVLM